MELRSDLAALLERLSAAAAGGPISGSRMERPWFVNASVEPWMVEELLRAGSVADGGGATIVSMHENECHTNAMRLMVERDDRALQLWSGFALSDDGIWRIHSWVVSRDGIIETTLPRRLYFGIHIATLEATERWFAAALRPLNER